MFNFYVVLAGHDKVSDAGRATTCRRKLKAPSLQTKSTKNEEPPENMGFKGKSLKISDEKKEQKHYSQPFKKTQWDTRTLRPSIDYRPCKQ